jgi:5'-3' exonuclease
MQRKEDKKEAKKEYNRLKSIQLDALDENEKEEIVATMDLLKKKFIHIKKEDKNKIKSLIISLGLSYYDAPGEADDLCSMLVMKKVVWACLSEDMDMFVYGCNRVLRYFSLLHHTLVLYNTKSILFELGIDQKEFREICVLSGTDYNMNQTTDNSLNKTLKLFKKYVKHNKKLKKDKKENDFYEWLLENESYIEDYDYLQKIYKMFDLSRQDNLKQFEHIKIMNGPIKKKEIQSILEEDGFVF